MIKVDNINDGDEVFQRCVLVTGRLQDEESNDHVVVETLNETGETIFPKQQWPMCQGYFKALVMLSPGQNKPPLHLAILVAKDSPLLMDCPPAKFGALSNAHSGLEAAIAKFRMTAYMWQALTAEDLWAKGLGRRSFRLEEEWALDTVSAFFATDKIPKMRSTAKIHLVRTTKTVDELRDAQIAQQNPSGSRRDELHEIFTQALKAHGSPFLTEAKPVVAGLILDSHFDVEKKMILGHAALGAHHANGLSLGIFGSHLTYAWPRFLEEVSACLTDLAKPGDTVGNDNNECASMWEACAVGQGAFLHEVGHAFSAPHTSGIMQRGYSPDWPKCFLAETAYCARAATEGVSPVTRDTRNNCVWDMRDALRFHGLPHFRHPGDAFLPTTGIDALLQDDEDFMRLRVLCAAGITHAFFNDKPLPTTTTACTTTDAKNVTPSLSTPATSLSYTIDELEALFPTNQPLNLELLALNGRHRVIDIWQFFSNKSYVRIPGTTIRLRKSAVESNSMHESADDWQWTVMLKKRSRKGTLVAASKIDVRVGCAFDGAIVHYKDGTQVPCGPRGKRGEPDPDMGGHQAKKIALGRGVDVVKVAVNRSGSWDLGGMRLWLSNGRAIGALNKSEGGEIESLVPDVNERIVGFFGTSANWGMCKKFGILTAPKNVELPDSVYDMEELQNIPKGRAHKRVKRSHHKDEESDHTEDEDTETSEDEDNGYDHDSDLETDGDE
ncbi:putative peptidase family-domain-containing protein [Bombardia bombarda]|uniref:Peptidase family-domain-containing protein n=1 Tax=Bombardia bombarda TaxID=252184 RepID=A0AA39XMJ7_9PEZI|nr:putative peptidase family-domain-containing protein [Bombardia bombarda]